MLREIPYGETTTYGALAKRLSNRRLAQRVGQENGRNPVSIVAPCHRVVGAGGSWTGYAGGLDRKRFQLELEEPAGITGFATVLESQTSRFTRLNWSANLTFWITHDLPRQDELSDSAAPLSSVSSMERSSKSHSDSGCATNSH